MYGVFPPIRYEFHNTPEQFCRVSTDYGTLEAAQVAEDIG